MKTILFFLALSCLSIGRLNSAPVNPSKGFAVVELFTSEGCSSCPPADELVARIQKENTDKSVYILAFHVDYWNKLGWKDVFSNTLYSKRQYQYAQWLKLSSVYTPQIVVNGSKEFVGSEEAALRSAVTSGLQHTAAARLILKEPKVSHDNISIQYDVEGISGQNSVVLALIEKSAETNVKRGENGGHILRHVQIVRNLEIQDLDGKKSNTIHIDIPEGLNRQNLEMIAFLQSKNNGEIKAAAKAVLPF